ncbi:hypothetical protein [Methanobrevibacter sp.]|uniref:hypothetical protein n=1 Tax=Methanobrevibacter sp. TaxID=66852 RepID=UPI0025F65375|nr:hypothetical protein [Methanobrevibacter sp.]MBR4447569.1 hypothetical protein [Methanobrevibacter sp.]
MHTRKLMVLAIILVLFVAGTTVFAESSNVQTHEYNFANKVLFNISDDLTNETEFQLSPEDSLDVGVYYDYPDEKVICSLWCVGEDGVTDFEGHQEDSSYEKIDSNRTSQGYKTYIFKDSNEYDVFIELDNLTVEYEDGAEMQYLYFSGNFETLCEAQTFIDTFKVNETVN